MKERTIWLYCPDCGYSDGNGMTREELLAITKDTTELRCGGCGESPPIGDYHLSVWRVLQLLKEDV